MAADELNSANEIHVTIMLDFPSEVIQWMVGIKKLIHELIQSNESRRKKNEENNKKEEQEEGKETHEAAVASSVSDEQTNPASE